jgi:site-specific DNA recombinase
MTNGYFSYIRVSTVRQGQTGTSLIEQREAIQRYASRWGLNIIREYEEKETAAKSGRPIFLEMLRELKHHKASGIIIHKIDRSARNLKDWASLGEFIDDGLDVHFANENLDLVSRGGRLSADIQAVVAADYIRNLREEVKKGFYGRLKQGLYPMPAPIGYLNMGSGKVKTRDPIRGPLVRKAFDYYGSGLYSICRLVEEMYVLGLRTRTGKKVSKNSMGHLLHNPFYIGLIQIGVNGEMFAGRHEPLVTKSLFDRVQSILKGRAVKQPLHHEFVFRRLLTCRPCNATLIGERQKGFVYHRCHNRMCKQKTVREDAIERAFVSILQTIQFTEPENEFLRHEIGRYCEDIVELEEKLRQALDLQIRQIKGRLSGLTDVYIDGAIDKSEYVEKKNQLLEKEQACHEQLARSKSSRGGVRAQIHEILELANKAYTSYKSADIEDKREMIESTSSNLQVFDKTVLIKLKSPFQIISNRYVVPNGGAQRRTDRTLSALAKQLVDHFKSIKTQEPEEKPVEKIEITKRRLQLAFRRANGSDVGNVAGEG